MLSVDPKAESPLSVDALAVRQMSDMIRAYRISQVVGTIAQLGIPDRLAGGSLTADELALLTGCHVGATNRFMRAASALGLVVVGPDARFILTALGQTLRSDVSGSARDSAIALTCPGHWLPWGRLSDTIRTGRRHTVETLGAELFEYYSGNPAEGRAFTGAMSVSSAQLAGEVARIVDTSSARLVLDIGGADGALISALLAKNPTLAGAILERPEVVPHAQAAIAERGLASRCRVFEGNFFTSVPEADVFLLKYIIHNWDDDQSILILSNCMRALRPKGRVVLVERVVSESDDGREVSLADLNMLALLPGRERTRREYADLISHAGLRLDRVTKTSSLVSVIEASSD
jgi:phospholipid N-methyltransferase